MKKIFVPVVLLFFAVFACTKKDAGRITSVIKGNSVAAISDTEKIPINDLGLRTYRGFVGGLYPNGVNTPKGQYAKDLHSFAASIVPLDATGAHSFTGKIGFISLGGSTGGRNMVSLKDKTTGNPLTNPFLVLANCNNGRGAGSLNSIMDSNDPYWDHVYLILTSSHITANQVQVIYLESEDSTNTHAFPGRSYTVRDEIEECLRVCKAKFKNLKFVYLLGRTTTFNVTSPHNQEPCPYYNGWANKFVIEDQVNGVPGTEYKGDNAVAPMVTWGFYQWTDGSAIPRSDGFVWQESDTEDGIHATAEGQDSLSSRFQHFLLTDAFANIWYGNHSKPAITP